MRSFLYEFKKLLYPTLQFVGIFGLMVLVFVGLPFVIVTIFSLPQFMFPLLALFIISMSLSVSVLIDKWSQGWFISIVLYVLASIGICISMLLIGGTVVGVVYLLQYYTMYTIIGAILLYLIVIGVKAYKESKKKENR
ncbi:hypothetical protein Alsa1_CDS0164 [Staphylococcus phage Alsa_1]|nr:hypothetical protein Alsa1_CDS0164 [Staphylococcus phage Alsa_1]